MRELNELLTKKVLAAFPAEGEREATTANEICLVTANPESNC